jgi:hypothetical protein
MGLAPPACSPTCREIVGSNFEHYYENVPSVDRLREYRRRAVGLNELTPEQLNALAAACVAVRPNLIEPYFRPIQSFRRTVLTRGQIGDLLVPPNVWHPQSQGRFERFAEFVLIRPLNSDPADSRNVPGNRETYNLPVDPVTVGLRGQDPILLDGYHRAVAFWRYGPADSSLQAYVPAAQSGK